MTINLDRYDSERDLVRFSLQGHHVKAQRIRQHEIRGDVRDFPVGGKHLAGMILKTKTGFTAYTHDLVDSGGKAVHGYVPTGEFGDDEEALGAIADKFDFSRSTARLLRKL